MPSQSTKERTKLRVAIKEFNDELLNVAKIQVKMEKKYSINEEQVIKIDKLHDEIWKFDEPIKNLEILLEKAVFKEKELIEATKEKISGLQAELECNQDSIMQEESETFKMFSRLYRKRLNALYELDLKGKKLVRLGVSQTKIDAAKESSNLGQSSWWKNCSL